MHSILEPEDPFNLSNCIGVHAQCFARGRFRLHAKLRSDFFLVSLQLILKMIKKYVMADLRNCSKV